MMDSLLPEKDEFSALYTNDVIVFSNSSEEHMVHLWLVLQCLRNAGLTVKQRKCQLGLKEDNSH